MRLLLGGMFVGLVAALAAGPEVRAGLAVPGSHQTENGGCCDWDPGTAPYMTETPPASGVHTLNLALSAAGQYVFKILDDQGTPPAAWGDPELTPGPNSWFVTDAAGGAAITIDTNTYADGFAPASNRVSVSTDTTVLPGFFAVGDWMDEAGIGGDWNPGNPLAVMSNLGGGLYGLDVTIAAPGNYQYKATKGDWSGQWGTDGRNENAATWLFTTTQPSQAVRLLLKSEGAISVQFVPEPATATLVGLALVATVGFFRRRR